MQRLASVSGLVACALMLMAGLVQGEDALPKLPSSVSHLQVVVASASRGESGVELRLLMPLAVPRGGELVPEGWKTIVLYPDAKECAVFDAKGNPIESKSLLERLKKNTAILLSMDIKPDPFHLQTTKDDTVVVVASREKLFGSPAPTLP